MPKTNGKKDVHLVITDDLHRLARIECAKAEIDLSAATEVLYSMWAHGHIDMEKFKVIAKLFKGETI